MRATALRSPLVPYALAVLSGVLYFLGWAGFDLWPLTFVAFVPVLVALDLEPRPGSAVPRARRALAIGFVFGLTTNLGGFYWLVGTLERFSGFPYALCLLFGAILCAYQGVLLMLFGWLWHRARVRGWPVALAATAPLAALETLFPLLFEYYFGASLHDVPALIQIADLGGPVLVTAMALLVNVGLYELVRARLARAHASRLTVGIAAAALAATLAYGAYRVHEVDARAAGAPTLRVGVVQTSMDTFAKREDPMEGLRRHVSQSLELEVTAAPDLLVWPESAYTFFLPESVTNVRRNVTGRLRTPVLFGGLARRRVDGVERHFNTAYLADAHGDLVGSYDKTYLLAFGEYIPFGETFPSLYDVSRHSGRFTPGTHVRPLELDGHRIATLICYEDILPSFVRRAVQSGDPHLLVNITNDSWFGDTHEPWQHLALAKFRSVEHHRALVRSTNSGVSAVIDPVGRVVTHGGIDTRENLSAVVPLLTGHSFFEHLGNWPGWLGVGLTAWMAVRRRRPRAVAAKDEGASVGPRSS